MTINTTGLEGMKYFESSGLFAITLILLVIILSVMFIHWLYVRLIIKK